MAARGLHVIAGSARGRRLRVPRRGDVRPTSGRVKEAVFSALEARGRVRDARVLDLFAGSGGLGIEALSRGAATALFVERDADAVATIAHNLAVTGFEARATVRRGAVAAVLGAPRTAGGLHDLVLCDPPYDLDAGGVHTVLRALVAGAWLAPDATVVVETRVPLDPVAGLRTTWSRRFGDTLVAFLEPEESGTPAPAP